MNIQVRIGKWKITFVKKRTIFKAKNIKHTTFTKLGFLFLNQKKKMKV